MAGFSCAARRMRLHHKVSVNPLPGKDVKKVGVQRVHQPPFLESFESFAEWSLESISKSGQGVIRDHVEPEKPPPKPFRERFADRVSQ